MVRNNSIDICRLFFAYGVVAIHNTLFVELGENWGYVGTYLFTRFSVPFFFIVSGYFFFKKCNKFNIKNNISKLIKVFLFWNILNIPIYVFIYDRYENISKFIFDFFLNGMVTQLWYLPALIYATFISWVIIKFIPNKKWILVIAATLYTMACLLCSYYTIGVRIPIIKEICVLNSMHTYRSLFFMGPAFFLMGYLIVQIEGRVIDNIKTVMLLIISIVCYLIEVNFIIGNKLCENINDLVITPMMLPCLIFGMLLLINNPMPEKKAQGQLCRYIANFTYYFHLIPRDVFMKVVPDFHTIRFFLICIFCTIVAIVLYRINNKEINSVII